MKTPPINTFPSPLLFLLTQPNNNALNGYFHAFGVFYDCFSDPPVTMAVKHFYFFVD